MTTPHINQIIELRDGRRAMVYRIETSRWYDPLAALMGEPEKRQGNWHLSVVTSTGETSEVYL